MVILSVDTGYSFIKYAYKDKNGSTSYDKFITAIAPAGEVDDLGIGKKTSFNYNGEEYLVGEKALYKGNVLPTRANDFLTTYSPLFLYKIIKDNGLQPDLVTLSLSISEFKAKSKILKQACENFIVNDTVFSFRVKVFPQGLGIWKYAGSPENAVILDIGFNTIDVLTVIEGMPIPELSAGYKDMGVCEMASTVSEHISANIVKSYVPEVSVVQVLAAGKFKYKRHEYDISELIEQKKETYTKRIFETISKSSKLQTVLDRIDTFIVAGGGAYFIDDNLKESYGFVIPNKPEYANVLGFVKLAEPGN
ncbi:ParM/StbA family protein [Hippea maritima]|uniref:StbA family protein n=1 Tax=Hippea maritima (strain ATCC 700847 / DSM 10411 / MH2) TaxID=760142 RepID=F2LV65_HIPMA|nr:ParM/StbA family protein [Hippea maritima]AEA33649.1 StbA family protein [Hippea maritima DSM 10411]